jgi:hypothetical protein
MILLENHSLKVSLSITDGSIVELVDKTKKIDYIKGNQEAVPFRLEKNNEWQSKFIDFDFSKDDMYMEGIGYHLKWQVDAEIHIFAKVRIPFEQGEIIFTSEVVNHSEHRIPSLEYPIIANLQTITAGGAGDYLAHSFATGFLVHNPIEQFKADGDGFRYMPYPEGFSGATMQFFTYYGESKGGLYFAAYDSEHYSKWLNFYKNNNDLLEASFIHGFEDIGPKKGVRADYPVVIKLMHEGNWYEAAEVYRKWAEQQKWTQKGKLSVLHEDQRAKWLLEEMGLSTFGINAGHDRTHWIEAYHKLVDTHVFHVLGPDWPQTGQNYLNHVPGGFDDWFPTKFCKENLQVFDRLGDKYAPFEFDYLFNFNGADGDQGDLSRHMIPELPKSMDKYKFPFICPAAPFTQELHVKRDEFLIKEMNVDSIYYDISANNILKACMDPSHGHPIGAGKAITQAYWDNYSRTKSAMNRAAGKYIPMGTEMINEVFIDVLDYYQARAGAQPATDFEGWNIRELIKSGEATLIPLFTYVYHEYGPVRLDGWGNLTEEIGDLFYYTAARTYLWGGLYELNYEYCPMEVIDGQENRAEEHYYSFAPRGYDLSSERGEYLKQFAHMRTRRGNKYLAYGRMLRPLPFTAKSAALNWFHYNSDLRTPAYNDQGQLTVNTVVHAAWAYKNESLGFFFANVLDETQTIGLAMNMAIYELKGHHFSIDLFGIPEEPVQRISEIGVNDKLDLEISVPAKTVMLLEIRPLD